MNRYLFLCLLVLAMCISCSDSGSGTSDTNSQNVSGLIEHGGFLSLQHNLNRDDLTFTGQFIKYGYIYDYTDYLEYFSEQINEGVGPVQLSGNNLSYLSTTVLSNGNVLIAYRDGGNSGYGTFVIYNSSGSNVSGPVVFEEADTSYLSTTVLSNGNVLIAYRDGGNSGYGTFVIYNSSGSNVSGPVVFEDSPTTSISAAGFLNGNVFIAYYSSVTNGNVVIYDSYGNLVKDAEVFYNGGIISLSLVSLYSYGGLIAYHYDGVAYAGLAYAVIGPYGGISQSTELLLTMANSSNTISATAMHDSTFMAYSVNGVCSLSVLMPQCLQLEKVSSNEVRLWNYTGETLECILSVNQ